MKQYLVGISLGCLTLACFEMTAMQKPLSAFVFAVIGMGFAYVARML